MTIAERITDEIARWPDVTVVAHGSRFVEFRIGRRELGHLHGSHLADIPFRVRIREQLVHSHEILAQKARDIAARLGYTDPPADQAYSFKHDTDYHNWAEKNLKPDQFRAQVARGQPALIFFGYRQSPHYLWPKTSITITDEDEDDPPETQSGVGRLYERLRTHPSLTKDAPIPRTVADTPMMARSSRSRSSAACITDTDAAPLELTSLEDVASALRIADRVTLASARHHLY